MSDEMSLFALMDSHLSKTRINEVQIENSGNNTANSVTNILLSTPPEPRLILPNFFPGRSPMKDFLAKQICNTLKADEKQKQEEEEKRKLEVEMKKLKIDEKGQFSTVDGMATMTLHDNEEYIIDLSSAIIRPPNPNLTDVLALVPDKTSTKGPKARPAHSQTVTKLTLQRDKESFLYKPLVPDLPCTTDISYILKQKLRRGNCSSFGKIFCSKLRPIQNIITSHEIEIFHSKIGGFNFKTKSPGDMYREKQRKPKMSTRLIVDITDYVQHTFINNK